MDRRVQVIIGELNVCCGGFDRLPIEPGTGVLEWLKFEWESPAWLLRKINRHFGIAIDSDRFDSFLADRSGSELSGCDSQQPTFGELAKLILDCLTAVSFEAVDVAGRRCEPAGFFRGIADLIEQTHPGLERFAPSTPIMQRLKGRKLGRFWTQMGALSGITLPELVCPLESVTSFLGLAAIASGCSFLLLVCLGLAESLLMILGLAWAATVALVFLWVPIVLAVGDRLLRAPRGLRTFRQLALYAAAWRPKEAGEPEPGASIAV